LSLVCFGLWVDTLRPKISDKRLGGKLEALGVAEMIIPSVSATGIREAVKELKQVDPTLLKDLRKDLRAKVGPLAKQVADAVPTHPAALGYGQPRSETGWSPVRPSVTFTPGKSRKKGNYLVSIRVNPVPAKGRRGLYIGEVAGYLSNGSVEKGRRLINVLNQRYPMKGKGGRFAYTKFRTLRPDAVALATSIVQSTVSKINRKLDI
jgi:hypothetical protein